MRICLVPYPVLGSAFAETLVLPAGVPALATLLDQAGHQVTIVDPTLEVRLGRMPAAAVSDPGQVATLILAHEPDLVGFSTICTPYPRILRWARGVRERSGIPLLLGGPQATVTAPETLGAFPWVDMVLRGEAERSVVTLVECLARGGDLAMVPGLAWRRDGRIVQNLDAPLIEDLDTLPTSAYHYYPDLDALIGQEALRFSLEAGRGCPCDCSFCSTAPFFQRRYRTKSPERLVGEMQSLHLRYGVTSFSFAHDQFTANKAYVRAFCQYLSQAGLHTTLRWRCNSRIDTVDEALLGEMAAAGCSAICFGVETGSPRIQSLINKRLRLQRVQPTVRAALKCGMVVKTHFICGFPQEEQTDLRQTLSLVLDLVQMGTHLVQLGTLSPLIGSDLHRTHGHALCYDGHFSDVPQLYLTPEELRLVRRYPEIFASFYHFETPHLHRHLLYAMTSAVQICPHFLVSLRDAGADLVAAFRSWADVYPQYMTRESDDYRVLGGFRSAFYRFLRDTQAGEQATDPHVAALIEAQCRSLEAAHKIMAMAVADPGFRERFQAHPAQVLGEYDLAADELAALKRFRALRLKRLAGAA